METARNAVTGVEYQGTNAATLGTGKWATFLQWKGAGRSIKKGEKGTRIIKFLENEVTSNKPGVLPGTGKAAKTTKVGFRYYTVFEEGQTVAMLACGHTEAGYPALSRYGHGDICSPCGTREAFEGNFLAQ